MPPRLETVRLILRPFKEDDLQAAYAVFEGHPDVYQYDPGYPRSFVQRSELILRYARENDLAGCGTLAVVLKETQVLIGYCGLQFYILPSEPLATPEVELFYKLGRDYWHQGYASEACREVLRFAFEDLRLERIVSCVDWRNANSIRLLERLGGVMRPAPALWPGEVIGIIKNPKIQHE